MKRLFVAAALAFSLGGCANLTDAFKIANTTFANPAKPVNIYQVKLAFAAGQDLIVRYQRDCFGSNAPPYPVTVVKIKADPVLSVQCAHRVSRYRVMKDAENKAYEAIATAEDFIARNPSGSAAKYIAAAWKAVTDYRAKVGI